MPAPDLPPALARAVELIRADRSHGASWLARQAAEALYAASSPAGDGAADAAFTNGDPQATLAGIARGARALAAARPSMAVLANVVARIWQAGVTPSAAPAPDRIAALHGEAARVLAEGESTEDAILAHARPLLREPVYTQSRSGTVETVLTRMVEDGALRRFIVSESRPGGEGLALARVLAARGGEVTLVADAACGVFVREAAAVVVGADSVRADGGVVNKVGTYPLALAARAAGVPVYVLCEAAKIAAPAFPLVFEEMDPAELLPEPVPNLTARNPYFEYTPPELVTAVVTEDGPLSRDAIRRRAERAGTALDLLRAAPIG